MSDRDEHLADAHVARVAHDGRRQTVASMRSSARSRRASRRSTRARKLRPSLSTTSASGRFATCAFVTIAPSLAQITPEPAPPRPSRTATVLVAKPLRERFEVALDRTTGST